METYVSDHNGTSAKITVAGETIEATFLHPFWVVSGEDLADRPIRSHLPHVPEMATTSGRWVDAGDVHVGDQLLLRDGRILPVEAIQHQPYRDKVYNFHVDDFECYAVGNSGVLVHNTNGDALEQWIYEVTQRGAQIANQMAEAGYSKQEIAQWLAANSARWRLGRMQCALDGLSDTLGTYPAPPGCG